MNFKPLILPFVATVFDYGTWSGRGVCNQLHQKGRLNPISPMGGARVVLAPMVVQKVVEIPDGASCFVFDPICKVEFPGEFILNKLPSGQHVQVTQIGVDQHC